MVEEDSDLEATHDQADFSLYPLAPVRWPCDLWRPSYKSSLVFMKGSCKYKQRQIWKKGTESMQNQNICSKCQGSVHFFEIAASKKGKNPCKTKIFFQSVRVLCLFFVCNLQEPFKKSKNCQAGFVTWPSKVIGLLGRCQRVEGKISFILSDLEVTVLNHIPQKFHFCKFSY